ncbi:MAG TPA: hypothetical protein VIX82_04925, partial [Solirubrobacteraceae bacterium]
RGGALHVSADRMAVDASGTVAQIEHAFSTSLSYHRVQGERLRLNDRGSGPLGHVPSVRLSGPTILIAIPPSGWSAPREG